MKQSLFIFVFTILFKLTNAQEKIFIEKNAEHVIYYSLNDNFINVYVEDLKDNEDNISPYNVVKHGSGNICGFKSPDYNALSDACIIEVDINQNNKFDDNLDLGFIIADLLQYGYSYKTNPIDYNNPAKYIKDSYIQSIVIPYYLKKRVGSNYTDFFPKNKPRNLLSRVQGNVNWTNSSSKDSEHLIYKFEIPINEVVSKKNSFLNLRLIVLRVADYKFLNTEYGTFYYPDQNCNNIDSLKTYKIDLSQSKGFKNFVEKNTKINKIKNVRALYTQSIISKSKSTIPEWEGSYIKLNSNKYIEISKKIQFKYGGMFHPSNLFQQNLSYMQLGDWEGIEKNPIYYQYAEEIDTTSNILSLKTSVINGIFLNLSSFNSQIIDHVTLRKYNEYELKDDGSEMFFPISKTKLPLITNLFGFFLARQKIYFAGDVIELKRLSMSNGYLYTPAKLIEPGIYSFSFNNDYGYIFEIIK